MNILRMGRGTGKTTLLVQLSAKSKCPIICAGSWSKKAIKKCAEELDLEIPEPLTVADIQAGKTMGAKERSYYIDDLDHVLHLLLNRPIRLATFTPTEREIL